MAELLPFGPWLKHRRRLLDLTQDGLARRASCSTATIKKIEAGDLLPSKQLAELLATALGVPVGEHAAFIGFARSVEATEAATAFAERAAPVPAMAPAVPPPYSRLPAQLTSVVGREREVATVSKLLRRPSVRLLTLTGPAGIGKTRLSLEVAAQVQADFADRVCFVPLAPIRDAALIAATIARSLGVREVPEQPLIDTLATYLQDRALLLVLDNFEQVIDGALVIKDLLLAAPHVKALVTSREVLNVYGEQEFPVPPLGVPDLKRLPHLEALALYPSVELFVERAQASRPDWELDAANAAPVAGICAWLDGLPLAIEMAAACIKWATPDVLLAQLSQRLHILTNGPHDLSPRQQTLRGAIDWSYDLLDPVLQLVFNRLGIFIGGATLTAIAVIAAREENPSPAELFATLRTHLHMLVDKSLLCFAADEHGEERYWMLETIREYAHEKLASSGELRSVQDRHAAFYRHLVASAAPEMVRGQQMVWLKRLEIDQDNVRAALAHLLSAGDPLEALQLADSLFPFWNPRSEFSEGRRWLLAAARNAPTPSPTLARALNRAGVFAAHQGLFADAEAIQREAIAIQEELGDQVGVSRSLQIMAIVAGKQRDFARASDLLSRSLEIERELQNPMGLAVVLNNLAVVAQHQRDYVRAEALLAEAFVIKQQIGDPMGLAVAHHTLGVVRARLGQTDEALRLLLQSLRLRTEVGDKHGLASSLEHCAFLVHRQGRSSVAAQLLGAAAVLRTTIATPHAPDEQEEYSTQLAAIQAALPAATFAGAWATGETLPLADLPALVERTR